MAADWPSKFVLFLLMWALATQHFEVLHTWLNYRKQRRFVYKSKILIRWRGFVFFFCVFCVSTTLAFEKLEKLANGNFVP